MFCCVVCRSGAGVFGACVGFGVNWVWDGIGGGISHGTETSVLTPSPAVVGLAAEITGITDGAPASMFGKTGLSNGLSCMSSSISGKVAVDDGLLGCASWKESPNAFMPKVRYSGSGTAGSSLKTRCFLFGTNTLLLKLRYMSNLYASFGSQIGFSTVDFMTIGFSQIGSSQIASSTCGFLADRLLANRVRDRRLLADRLIATRLRAERGASRAL